MYQTAEQQQHSTRSEEMKGTFSQYPLIKRLLFVTVRSIKHVVPQFLGFVGERTAAVGVRIDCTTNSECTSCDRRLGRKKRRRQKQQ